MQTVAAVPVLAVILYLNSVMRDIVKQVKIKLSLRIIKHHAMKMRAEVKVKTHTFLTSALGGGRWSSSRPPLYSRAQRPWYPLDRGLARPQGVTERCGGKRGNRTPIFASSYPRSSKCNL
jgi:hypothetical protein